MFAVVVTFHLEADKVEAFMPLMRANAQASLENEEGCRQFDVALNPDTPTEVFLYELYSDKAAFDAHLSSAHFKAFDAAAGSMIAAKSVKTYSQVHQ